MASSRPRLRAVPSPSSAEPPPWSADVGVDAVIQKWLARRAVVECLAAERTLPAQAPSYAPIPAGLDPRLVQGLARRGITQLYDHQAQAIEAALGGRHVVIATPTASGKSLCLHLPVLNAISKDPDASALYLYPTKALSRDQEQGLHALIADAELGIPALVYDGDTPADARRAAREQGRVLLTNPDMLHSSLLPHHTRWARVFQRLEYVVLDELHSYRGVFGSHLAHVITRLLRIAEFHGSRPRFILASATIGNPREHAARLLGLAPDQLTLVSGSGAPAAERRLFLYNPPVVNAELGIRGSSLKHAVRLALDLLAARVSTILFAGSRNSVEVMLKYIRDQSGVPADAVFGYRGGYLPEKRRAIERGLREGTIRCVVATNALELGIDIGDLDAVICVGYPGSVAATWQRFGRAGRRGDKSIGVLVLNSQATDQFLAAQPEYVLEAGAEEARIDPENVEILLQHLKCAAFELPFAKAEGVKYAALDAPGTRDALEYLSRQGLLYSGETGYTWTGDSSPATYVSLRSISWDNFVIIELGSAGTPRTPESAGGGGADRTLAELDWRSAHTMLHEQAIYQHDAAQYQVERLDYENHKAYVRRVEPDYFTTALTNSRVTILDPAAERELTQGKLQHGDVEVIETVTGYKKIKFVTHENAGYGDVRLPDLQMHTTAFWWTLQNPRMYLDRCCFLAGTPRAPSPALLIAALRGAGAALETVASIALMCEPRDIGRTLGSEDGPTDHEGYRPTLFLYDALPGGVGLARRIFERAEELFAHATRLIAGCRCKSGCPACIGAAILSEPQSSATPSPISVGTPRTPIAATARKAAALALLEGF